MTYSKDILLKLPREYNLFVGMFGDAAHIRVSKELHEEVDELVLVPMGKRGPRGSQCTSRHFLVNHTMFDDFFGFVPPFFGLFRLLQSFVIEDLDQVVIVPFTASVAFDLVVFGVVVASEGDAMVSPATIHDRNKRCASFYDLHVDDECH